MHGFVQQRFGILKTQWRKPCESNDAATFNDLHGSHRDICMRTTLVFSSMKSDEKKQEMLFSAHEKGLLFTGLYRMRYTSADAVGKLLKVTPYF